MDSTSEIWIDETKTKTITQQRLGVFCRIGHKRNSVFRKNVVGFHTFQTAFRSEHSLNAPGEHIVAA